MKATKQACKQPSKLSATQRTILQNAAKRPDGNIEPLPDNVTPGVRQRVIDGLLSRGLVMKQGSGAKGNTGAIHTISHAGYEAIGKEPPAKADATTVTDPRANPDRTAALSDALVKTRPGTKQEALITLLARPEGATIDELAEATGWQRHTVRGTMSHTLKKRLGLEIQSSKEDGQERRYRV